MNLFDIRNVSLPMCNLLQATPLLGSHHLRARQAPARRGDRHSKTSTEKAFQPKTYQRCLSNIFTLCFVFSVVSSILSKIFFWGHPADGRTRDFFGRHSEIVLLVKQENYSSNLDEAWITRLRSGCLLLDTQQREIHVRDQLMQMHGVSTRDHAGTVWKTFLLPGAKYGHVRPHAHCRGENGVFNLLRSARRILRCAASLAALRRTARGRARGHASRSPGAVARLLPSQAVLVRDVLVRRPPELHRPLRRGGDGGHGRGAEAAAGTDARGRGRRGGGGRA